MARSPTLHYVRRNFDEVAILGVATKLAFESDPQFSEWEQATIAAMLRAHPQAGDGPEALGQWLSSMDEDQIGGVVSNTKGVLHEMEFVRLENEDGDSIYASLFEASNHPGMDIRFFDANSDQSWALQLKATDSAGYVQDWIDAHPNGEIAVTSELAERLGLPDSGFSNAELTACTESVVDRLVEASEDSDLWDYFPGLTAISIALVIWELLQRHQRGEISRERFNWMAARVAGVKVGKIGLLVLGLSIPGLNVVVGAGLVVSLLFSGASIMKAAAR